ncbi:hypothetical protein KC19_VG207000 [Ceratodon purpureus]|uniref:Uncharacterized protein n=1 Tax=Ceratodon purpureus TaxID=3225 RepID=A0A8T0HSE1_CERPU|nr:hypothetical protein KC19_VG207000 [Ceratodon purpureus]
MHFGRHQSRRRGRIISVKRTVLLLLQQVWNLIKYFLEYLDVLISVARKTDSVRTGKLTTEKRLKARP